MKVKSGIPWPKSREVAPIRFAGFSKPQWTPVILKFHTSRVCPQVEDEVQYPKGLIDENIQKLFDFLKSVCVCVYYVL